MKLTHDVYNVEELDILREAMAKIQTLRKQEEAATRKLWSEQKLWSRRVVEEQPVVATEPSPTATAIAERATEMKATMDRVAPLPAKLTAADMEKALRGFIARHDLSKTRALLTEFGIDRVGEIPAERQDELHARLQA